MVTLQDIAARVGVSHAVVSSVLNNRLGKIRVSEARRLAIIQAAADMGYVPNRSARSLATRKNKALGLIVNFPRYTPLSTAGSAYVLNILSGMHDVCDPKGYHCLYALADMQSPSAFEMPAFIRERSVDGVVLAGYVHPEVEEELLRSGLPIFHISSNAGPHSRLQRICADMEGAVREAIDRAACAGLERIHLYMPGGPGPAKIVEAFQRHAEESHPDLTVTSAQSSGSNLVLEESRAHGLVLSASDSPPQLIVTSAHVVPYLFAGLSKGGFRCPEEIQLLLFGINGGSEQRLGTELLTLSLICNPLLEISRLIAHRLLEQIEGTSNAAMVSERIPCIFIPGQTAPSLAESASDDVHRAVDETLVI